MIAAYAGDEDWANALMRSGQGHLRVKPRRGGGGGGGGGRREGTSDRSAGDMIARVRGTGSVGDIKSLVTKYRACEDDIGRAALATVIAGSMGALQAPAGECSSSFECS